MSDASYVECVAPGAALQFMTRNDWFIDALRRLVRIAPQNETISILAALSWQQEILHDYGGYAECERVCSFHAANARPAAAAIREFVGWCEKHAEEAVRAIEGVYGKPEHLLDAIGARLARKNPQNESVGGEEGDSYEFFFDVLESIGVMLERAAAQEQTVRYATRRNRDWE